MAGKKGMKHARPRTPEERDKYALSRIEHLIDKLAENTMLKCSACAGDIPWKDIPQTAVTMLMKRYDKLRATRTESEVTHKGSILDILTEITPQKQRHNEAKADEASSPSVH